MIIHSTILVLNQPVKNLQVSIDIINSMYYNMHFITTTHYTDLNKYSYMYPYKSEENSRNQPKRY